MGYEEFLSAVEEMDFVENREQADSLIKGTFGILASELDEEHARVLTSKLPEPLTFEKLRGHQRYRLRISFDQYLETLSGEFNLHREHSERLVEILFGMMLKAVDTESFNEVKNSLPEDWRGVMEEKAAEKHRA